MGTSMKHLVAAMAVSLLLAVPAKAGTAPATITFEPGTGTFTISPSFPSGGWLDDSGYSLLAFRTVSASVAGGFLSVPGGTTVDIYGNGTQNAIHIHSFDLDGSAPIQFVEAGRSAHISFAPDATPGFETVQVDVIGPPSFMFLRLTSSAPFSIDNIVLESVPEPSAWAMMLMGFGALGSALRGRRPRTAVL